MTFNEDVKPFIKRFTNNGYFYIYDVNTKQVVEVEKPVYDIIHDYVGNDYEGIVKKYSTCFDRSVIKKSVEKIKNAQAKYGLFSNFRPKMISMGIRDAGSIKKLHNTYGLNQMLLELTEDCNLNCRYCQTSGKYAPTVSMRSEMSQKTCKKMVDFFCANVQGVEKPAISFYGGEPLLKFDLIRETVEYINKTYGRGKFIFSITTNGTLLNKEIIDFFIKNDFLLAVSLDGPEKVNDRYRVTRNGKGTFHTIMNNLGLIKKYNSSYFSRNVSISCVLAPPFDNIDDILNFFSTNETLSEKKTKVGIRSSLVETKETSFIEDFGLEKSMKEYPSIFDKFVKRIKAAILAHDLSSLTIEKTSIYSILGKIARRSITSLHDHERPVGACHIGQRRFFVRANGDFFVCERSANDYKIGCADKGFDYETIAAYYRKQEEVLAECKNCWAINLCERCWAVIGKLDIFNGEEKEKFCSYQKAIIEKAIKVYTELLREDSNCLKVFKNTVQ